MGGVHNLFNVKMLFDARMHLGHTVRSLNPQMNKFVFGSRFDMCILDLDQTALHLRQALNFTAHIAYRGGIILFVCRQSPLIHMVDRAAQECGEYSATSAWTSEIFTAPNMMFGQEVRNLDPLKVNFVFPGEASRPCGDGPHQGQAPVQGASSNNRFCKGLLLCQCNFYFDNVLRLGSQLW